MAPREGIEPPLSQVWNLLSAIAHTGQKLVQGLYQQPLERVNRVGCIAKYHLTELNRSTLQFGSGNRTRTYSLLINSQAPLPVGLHRNKIVGYNLGVLPLLFTRQLTRLPTRLFFHMKLVASRRIRTFREE